MSGRLFRLTLVGAVLAPAAALGTPSDRHPGVYQFMVLPEGYCASAQRQAGPVQPPKLSRLGDLPPAYAIRLTAPSAVGPPAASPLTSLPPATANAAPFDPCARVGPALMRVR